MLLQDSTTPRYASYSKAYPVGPEQHTVVCLLVSYLINDIVEPFGGLSGMSRL
jgi:hypothetical protein